MLLPQALKIGFDRQSIAPGDTTRVVPYFEYRDGERQYFDKDHKFRSLAIIKGREYGHLINSEGENIGSGGNYLSPGIKFVANENINKDSVAVWVYTGTYMTFDRAFELTTTSEGINSFQASSVSASGNSSFSYSKHYQELTTRLKTQGDEDLIQYILPPKNMEGEQSDIISTFSDITTNSEEGKTSYQIGYGRIEIKGNELEPCRSSLYPQNFDLKGVRQPDIWKCDGDGYGRTSIETKHYIADIQACFSKQIARWKGDLTNVEAEINYSLCPKTAMDDDLEIINGPNDPDIREENYCSINRKINRTIKNLQGEGGNIEVYYPKAVIAHEEVHVEQIKELIDTHILGKKGMITVLQSEEYTLEKNKASNANEAQKILDPYFKFLWDITKTDIHTELLDIDDEGYWEKNANDAAIPPYESLLDHIKNRAQQANWQPCTE